MIDDNSNFLQNISDHKKHVNPKMGIVFIILIILHSYIAPLISLVPESDYSKYTNYAYLSTISAYAIIVLSIIIFGTNDLYVFQDHFSLWTIVLTCFLRASLGGKNEAIYKLFLVFLGLALLKYIIVNQKSIKTPSLKSVFIGLLWSIAVVVVAALLGVILDPVHGSLPSSWSILLTYIINTFVFQLSFVSVIEEAYFRGLIFGFLVMNGYKENTALFIQAILFWGIHYLKIVNPVHFFVVIPVLTLGVTLIIKKYKMLYLSIMLHTINNVFGAILVAIF